MKTIAPVCVACCSKAQAEAWLGVAKDSSLTSRCTFEVRPSGKPEYEIAVYVSAPTDVEAAWAVGYFSALSHAWYIGGYKPAPKAVAA